MSQVASRLERTRRSRVIRSSLHRYRQTGRQRVETFPPRSHRLASALPRVSGRVEAAVRQICLINGTSPENGTVPDNKPASTHCQMLSALNGSRRALYSGMTGKTKLQTDTINSASLKIISESSTFIDDSATVIGVPSALKSINETILSVREMIMDRTPIIISGPDTLMFIRETVIGEGPRTISGPKILISASQILISVMEILISGEPLDSRNQRVADLPSRNTYPRPANTYFHDGDTYFRGPNDYRKGGEDHF